MVRRITIAVLAAFLAGAVLAVPASSKSGSQAAAAKKAKKKCKKKKKKGKKGKGCKSGSGNSSVSGLPGQATPSHPTPPDPPPTPPTLHVASVGVSPNPVLAGSSTTGSVTLDAAAPSGGQTVDLMSSDASRVSVPTAVVVAAGQTSASFAVNTTSGGPLTATLTGSIGTSTANTQLSVVSTPSVTSVRLERACFTVDVDAFSSNRVTLDVPAPSDTLVSLLSSDPAALTVPPSVTVPSGSSSAFFSINAAAASSSVTVTATLGSSQATDTASVSDATPDSKASGVTLSPESIIAGDFSTATVTLDCEAPDGGTTVQLSTSDPTNVTVPATVTVPAGALSTTFNVTTVNTTPSGEYTISATAGGDTKSDTLTVNNLGT